MPKKEPTLSLAIICKPDEGKILDRALTSVYKYVDEIIIGISGEGNANEVAKKFKATVIPFQWEYDFAKARQLTFDKATKDWIMWIDSDDIVKNPRYIKKVLKATPQEAMAIMVKYDYERNAYGQSIVSQWRERIIRRESDYKWVGVLHETLIDHNMPPFVRTSDFEIKHLSKEGEDKITLRNLDILEKAVIKEKQEKGSVDPRLLYYLGVTYKAMGANQQAEKILREFVMLSGWDEQRFDAYINLSDIGLEAENKDVAIDSALLALKERPDYPDVYFQLGKVYVNFENWQKAIIYLKQGLKRPDIESDWIIRSRRPSALLDMSIALRNLGQFKEANIYLEKLRGYWPREKFIKKEIKINGELQKQKDVTDAFWKIARFNEKKNQSQNKYLMRAIPKELYNNPILLSMRWRYSPTTKWPKNSIAISCGESWEKWSPKSIEKGIGGSEETVIYLSKELAKKGFQVTVFNSCLNDAGVYDGVTYKNFWELNPKDEFDVFIVWRYPQEFQKNIKARKKYLWMHDVYDKEIFTPRILNNLDKVIVLSKYHRNLWPNIPEEKIMYSSNGIVPEQFEGSENRQQHRLIYPSCPSRGLEFLLDIWPEVRKKYPDAELYNYYGWFNFIKGNEHIPDKMRWLENIKEKMKQPGVVDVGRIGHKELAREFMKSDIWAYSCIFPEIFCLSAIKAQAGGAIPVVVPYAAVDETTQFGYKTKTTDMFSEETKKEFKEKLFEAFSKDFNRQEMIEWAKSNFSWEKVSEQWNKEFNAYR